MHNEEDMFHEAMDLGVKGYVLKESAAKDVISGIETVMRGQHFVSPTISEYMFDWQNEKVMTQEETELAALTRSEKRILRMISDNMTSKEIASDLGLSRRTVENHRANISQKLGLHGIHSLVKFAFNHKSSL